MNARKQHEASIPALRGGGRPLFFAIAGLLAAAVVLAESAAAQETRRVATLNASLYGKQAGELAARLHGGNDPQARRLAEIIQRVRPDILLLNEIDYEADRRAIDHFLNQYLAVPQAMVEGVAPAQPIKFPYVFTAPVNTGRASGYDLNRDGQVAKAPGTRDYGADAWGFGLYEGQYGMAVLSRYPIEQDGVRTFQHFRWVDMPDAQLPDDPETEATNDWYPEAALKEFPLSSKSHWDVPVEIAGERLHLLVSHPTPPVFDGPEDRNGRRNHDEIRFWADYVSAAEETDYHVDDAGTRGDLERGKRFVILGDLNSDPHDGDGSAGITRLLAVPELLDYPPPSSPGGRQQAQLQAGVNRQHRGDPQHDTLDAEDSRGPGNLRVDYVLPSRSLRVVEAGVFWPQGEDPLFSLVGTYPVVSSDHRLVWVDLVLKSGRSEQK